MVHKHSFMISFSFLTGQLLSSSFFSIENSPPQSFFSTSICKYTSLLYAPPLLLSEWLLLLPDPFSVKLPPFSSSDRLLREALSSGLVTKMKAWKETTSWRRKIQRRWYGDDRGRRRCSGDGGSDKPDTEAEVDAVQRKVFWGWGMKHKPRKQDVTDAVVLEEGSGLGLGFGN